MNKRSVSKTIFNRYCTLIVIQNLYISYNIAFGEVTVQIPNVYARENLLLPHPSEQNGLSEPLLTWSSCPQALTLHCRWRAREVFTGGRVLGMRTRVGFSRQNRDSWDMATIFNSEKGIVYSPHLFLTFKHSDDFKQNKRSGLAE